MLGVPIQPGGSDSQDLNRVVDHLIRVEGLSLAEAMEMVVPPIVDEIRSLPADLHPFYMYLRETMGPFAQGPVALIARHDDECVFSADALGLRPLWKLETPDDFIFSSEPGVVGCDDMVSEPQAARRRARSSWSRSTATSRALAAPRALARCSARSPSAGSRAPGPPRLAAPYDRALETGGPLEGTEIPGYTAAGPSEPVKVEDRVLAGLRLAARRRQALPADGVERRRADRLARLRRAARGAVAGAPEPRRLLQGDGRRGHQPGDRPRARDRALLDPRRVRPPAVAPRPRAPTRGRSRPRSR